MRLTSVRTVAMKRLPTQAVVIAGLGVLCATALMYRSQDQVEDTSGTFGHVPWAMVVGFSLLAVFAVAHYVLSAVALRAASGRVLPLREATNVQFAAAAVNRVVPNGFGGAAVNVRYLVRSGVEHGAAVSALGVLALIGPITDFGYGALLMSVGHAIGLPGAGPQLTALTRSGVRSSSHVPWALFVGIAAVAVFYLRRRVKTNVVHHVRHAVRHALHLLRNPSRVVLAMLASAGTTAVLSAGFAATVLAFTGTDHAPALGAIVVTYLVAATIGNAAPLPAFAGVTEAALVTGLTVSGLPFTTALTSTLVFRLVSFWLPLPIGIAVSRRLRRAELL